MKVETIAYISPTLRYDQQTRLTVVEYRHGDTGKIAIQFPAEKVMRQYREALSSSVAAASLPLLPGVGAPAPAAPAAPAKVSLTV